VHHWRVEIGSFQKAAAQRFSPSMRQRINVAKLYADAVEQLDGVDYDCNAPRPWPQACPFTLDDLVSRRRIGLEAMLVTPLAADRG